MKPCGWVFLIIVSILLTVGTCKGEVPPPLEQCKHALSACDTYATSLEGQVKQLKDEVEAYKKEVDRPQNTPITLYTALGGAMGGGLVGLGRGEVQQALIGATIGAGIGALAGLVVEGLTK